jgi:hypothetical protein
MQDIRRFPWVWDYAWRGVEYGAVRSSYLKGTLVLLVKIKNKYSVRDCEVIFLLIYMGFVFLIY